MEKLRPRHLSELLEILWRKKGMLLLMALVMLIATLIVIRRAPDQYESRALVVVNLRSGPEGMSEMTRFATLEQGLTSRDTFAALIRKYNLFPKAQNIDEAIESLQKTLKVETRMRNYSPSVPEAIVINHRHSEPKIAQALVTDLVKMLEQGNERLRVEATAEASRLTSQIAEVENRLKNIGPKRDPDMTRLEALSKSRADLAAALSRRQYVESSIETLGDTEYSLQRQIADQRAQISEHEKNLKATPASPSSAAYGALLTEKSKVEAEIQNYSDQYTDKHPKMIQLRNQLTELNRQISYLETRSGSAMPALATPEGRELLTMQRDLKRMETALELVQRQLQRKNQEIGSISSAGGQDQSAMPTHGVSIDDMARTEYDRLVIRYNWLLEKQDSMLKLSGAQGPAHMMFHVIDTPNLPRLPVAPNRLALQMIALGVAILFGLLIILALEAPRMFTINDERDIEYFLGAPVIALIPESLTPVERARKRKLRLTRSAIVLTLAVVLAPILIILLTYLKIFHSAGGQ